MSGKVGPLSRVYNSLIGTADKYVPTSLRPLWEHPAGPKTIFFWAPLCKWVLVIAGIGDMARPAETLSVNQCIKITVPYKTQFDSYFTEPIIPHDDNTKSKIKKLNSTTC